jgi:hypothetical protein
MKKVLIAGLIAVSAVGSAQANTGRDFLAVVGAVTLIQQVAQPRVVYQQQPQVIYQQQTYPQAYPQVYEYRTPPVYSPQYLPPSVSCVPAYTQAGQYIGCVR